MKNKERRNKTKKHFLQNEIKKTSRKESVTKMCDKEFFGPELIKSKT